MSKHLKYAAKLTFQNFGGIPSILAIIASGVNFLQQPKHEGGWMQGIYENLPSTALIMLIMLSLAFAWHWMRAPYHFEKEAHQATAARLSEAEKSLQDLRKASRVIDSAKAQAVCQLFRSIRERTGVEKLNVEYSSADEPADFAARLSEIATMAGFDSMPHSELWGGYDARERGVIVRFSEGEAFEAAAIEIANALEGIGLKATAKARSGMSEPHLSLYVARQ